MWVFVIFNARVRFFFFLEAAFAVAFGAAGIAEEAESSSELWEKKLELSACFRGKRRGL